MIRFSLLAISLILFVTGLVLIFSSVGRGIDAANTYLLSHGGGMDTNQFLIIQQEYINTYQWLGGILAVIGGLGFVRAVEPRSKA